MKSPNFSLRRSGIIFVALIALSQFAVLVPGAAAQTADEIVAKVLAARGGADKIRAVRSQRVDGKISFGPQAEGLFSVEFARPGKMHMEINVNGQTFVRVYDGKSAGWIINPFAPNKDVQSMDADDLRNISDESDFDGPLVDYQAKGNHIELLGKDELDGKQVYKLQLTNKNGDARTYFFDASTFLLVKWEGKRKADGQEVPVETFFSDYREVNGLKFAFEIDSDSPGSQQQQKITIEKITLDSQIDEGKFSKPAAPAAAAPAAEGAPLPSAPPPANTSPTTAPPAEAPPSPSTPPAAPAPSSPPPRR
jgi:outer membrane lipoprotein-sorting protein